MQVGGNSYLLWAIENYQDFCKVADEIAAKEDEVDDGMEDTEKLNEIIKGFK